MKFTMSDHLSLGTLHERSQMYRPNVGQDLDVVKQDHCVITHPATNKNRRTLVIKTDKGSWGFTLQSYGIHHRAESTIEYLTYVDYVELGGPADLAGMRKGDIILSVNGQSMENVDHQEMVKFLKSSGDTVRMVVLFEDCSRKVELHLRYMKLKSLLMAKEEELFIINKKLSQLHQSMGQSHDVQSVCSPNSNIRDLTPAVSALATLPRKAKQQQPKKQSTEIFTSKKHLVKLASNQQLYRNPDGGSLIESSYSPENISCSDCLQDIRRDCDNDRCVLSSGLLSAVSDSRYNNVLIDVSTKQYNSLPPPWTVKGQRSVDVPQITICPPTHDTQDSDFSATSLIHTSSDSGSSASSLRMSTDQLYTHDNDVTSIQGSLNVSDPHLTSSNKSSTRSLRTGFLRRSTSFRGSFHQSLSPSQGMSYLGSSNHVITEQNSRIKSDPELIRFRKGHLDLMSPDYMQRKQSSLLFRSVSSPAVKAVSLQSGKNLVRRSAGNKPDLAAASTPDGSEIRWKKTPEGTVPLQPANCLTVSNMIKGSGDCSSMKPGVNLTRYSDNHQLTKDSCLQNKPWYSSQDKNPVNYKDTLITRDKNGNVTIPDNILTESFEQSSGSHVTCGKQCSENSIRGSPTLQPCSAESDFKSGSRSLSGSSTELNSQSTGSSESVGVLSQTPTVTVPNVFDSSPMCSCLSTKQLAEEIVTFSKYKDLLNDINEEDECTKL